MKLPYLAAAIAHTRGDPSSWVLSGDGEDAVLDINFTNDHAWNDGNQAVISDLLTCTRATPAAAYYTKADGTLTTFAANTLRYGDNGLLVEESRTNLFTRSQEIDHANWSKYRSTVSANGATAPDGTATADSLVEDNTAGDSHGMLQTATIAANTTITMSAYVKRGAGTRNFRLTAAADVNGLQVRYDLDAVTSTSTSYGDAVYSSSSIVALANGWYRVTASGIFSATTPDPACYFELLDGTQGTYDGDNTSSLHIWGAQLEAGAFPTSYIPTTSTSVTRAADDVALSSNLGDGAIGTFYAHAVLPQVTFGARIWGSQVSAKTQVFQYATNTTSGSYNGAVEINTVAGSGGWATGAKNATAFDGSGFALCFNAGTVASDANTSGYDEEIQLGSYAANADFMNGYLKRLAFWNTRLSNEALQALTA